METSLRVVLKGEVNRPSLAMRAVAIALLLYVEKVLLGRLLPPPEDQLPDGRLANLLGVEHWMAHTLMAFGLTLAVLAYVCGTPRLRQLNQSVRATPLRARPLLLHALFAFSLAPLTMALIRGSGPTPAFVILSCLCALGALLSALAVMAHATQWRQAIVELRVLGIYAAVLGLVGASAVNMSQGLWEPTARITFDLVWRVLSPFVPSLQADPAHLVLRTDRFAVEVSRRCSGLEGIGLMLALSAGWLLLFRKEYIFPRALLLIPAGLLLIFALNVLRIAGLVLIGHAGYPDVAIHGFHSQAGWIAFTCAGCAMVLVSRQSSWLNRAAMRSAHTESENPTAAYLLPFIAILVAGMLAQAVSRGFETLYVLRLIAASVALLFYWRRLSALDWRFSWRGPAAGVAVLGLWWLAAHFLTTQSSMPAQLAVMSPMDRALWIAIRASAAVITVPIAEELAYRGFLLRRLQASDFEAVRFADIRWPAILISAFAFGLAHGSMWAAGVVAGCIFALILRRTERFGETVAAHATANAGLAALVLLHGQWQLW